jgi:hypothetical protein
MELVGGSGVAKPVHVDPKDVDLHDTDNSQLSASTTSNTTLPPLEMADAEKAQYEEEKKGCKKSKKRSKRKEEE